MTCPLRHDHLCDTTYIQQYRKHTPSIDRLENIRYYDSGKRRIVRVKQLNICSLRLPKEFRRLAHPQSLSSSLWKPNDFPMLAGLRTRWRGLGHRGQRCLESLTTQCNPRERGRCPSVRRSRRLRSSMKSQTRHHIATIRARRPCNPFPSV